MCVCVLCVQSLEKLAHPTISSSGVHFPSVPMSENEHFWMKWSRTLHSNPNSFRQFISPCAASLQCLHREEWNKISERSRSLVTAVISQEHSGEISFSVPFWHQGLPLKIVYCTSHCLHEFEMLSCWNILVISPIWHSCHRRTQQWHIRGAWSHYTDKRFSPPFVRQRCVRASIR